MPWFGVSPAWLRDRPTAGAALLAAAALACSEPSAPIPDGTPPTLVLPAEHDTVQLPVPTENQLPGDRRWSDPGQADAATLALWASPYVASAGDALDLFVHAAAATVSLQVYRLGWYGGAGGRLVHAEKAIAGGLQPACSTAASGLVACPWRRSTRLLLPRDWTGGVYLLKVRDVEGRTWSYPFVLRSRHPHRVTAVINQFTWQAYNKWGESSFYSTDAATGYTYPRISFDRPYLGHAGMSAAGGAGEAGGSNDLPAVRWLEAQGYDLGYLSDADLADSGTDLASLHTVVFVGHDEYWTWTEFDRVQALRDAGTHLAFLSGNNAYWNIRLGSGTVTGRRAETLTSYKYQPDPSPPTPEQTTTKFRNPPLLRPESRLIGPLYQSLLPGGASPPMVVAPDSLLGAETRAFLAAAGLASGDTIEIGSGTEGDEYFPSLGPPGLQLLLEATYPIPGGNPRHYHSTFYLAPSGAAVWASGTNRWAAYLDGERAPADPKVGRLTRVILDWMDAH
jgi:hypothetical protein